MTDIASFPSQKLLRKKQIKELCIFLPDCVFRDEIPRCTQESCQDTATSSREEGGSETTEEGENMKGLVKPGVCLVSVSTHVCPCVCMSGADFFTHNFMTTINEETKYYLTVTSGRRGKERSEGCPSVFLFTTFPHLYTDFPLIPYLLCGYSVHSTLFLSFVAPTNTLQTLYSLARLCQTDSPSVSRKTWTSVTSSSSWEPLSWSTPLPHLLIGNQPHPTHTPPTIYTHFGYIHKDLFLSRSSFYTRVRSDCPRLLINREKVGEVCMYTD